MSLVIERLGRSGEEWDRFVRAQPGATHCHLSGWRDVMTDVHGLRTDYLYARDESGEMAGVLPLVHVRSPVFGRYLVSVPFLNYGGPLGSPRAARDLAAAGGEIARRAGNALLELRSRGKLALDLPVSHRKITCVLDLPATGADVLWASLDGNVRRRVRRAKKAGITIAFGNDQLASFYQVFARHMRDLGTPTQPRRLFERSIETFPNDVFFACAYLDGTPIAALAGFRWADEIEVTWASALVAHKELAANMYVYWAAIEKAMQDGVRKFNFGRCTPGGGTHRFKSQCGARDETLWWYTGASAGRRAATPAPTDPAFAWGPRLWKRLPERLATAIGPHIARYIP